MLRSAAHLAPGDVLSGRMIFDPYTFEVRKGHLGLIISVVVSYRELTMTILYENLKIQRYWHRDMLEVIL